MKKSLPFALALVALQACGSTVVVGPVADASPAGDAPRTAADASAGDVVTPAQDVVSATDASDVVDTGSNSLLRLCRAACAREAQQCAGGSQGCVDGCLRIQSMPGAERCADGIIAALQCVVTNGFTCMGSRGSPVPACRPVFSAVESCVNAGSRDDAGMDEPVEPPPVTDDGGAPDA